jgi:preprotein translocase subunit YajC
MEVNSTVIGIGVIIILAFVYFVIKRNKKDQKKMENELNQTDIKPDKHGGDKI